MKTVIAFNYYVTNMIKDNGFDVDRVINACQSEANKSVGTEGESKRSAFKGGRSYSASGEMKVKDISWKESTPTDYSAKSTMPSEFVKWNDSIAAHFRKCGNPHGRLSLDTLPSDLNFWLQKFAVEVKPSVTVPAVTPSVTPSVNATKRNGTVKVPTVA